jgi:ribosomal protein S18 acetylase RimI-like enzyme
MSNSEPWVTLQRSYEEPVRMPNDPLREVYVATVAGEVVGFTILRMDGAFVAYIQTVGVLPEWMGGGIGSELMRFAEERIFRETPNAFICASSFNEGALRLYERLGYEVVGELTDYVVSGHSEILLRKSIGPLTEFKRSERESSGLETESSGAA